MVKSAYEDSTLLSKIIKRKLANKPLRIAFLDIDSTMTGSQKTTNTTRKKLEKMGYAIVYVTSRTEEMIMSSKAFQLSKEYGFDRPEPHLGKLNGKQVYLPPELAEPAGLLDPDIIAGTTGTQILVRQENGAYLIDKDYETDLAADSAVAWRQSIMGIVNEFNKDQKKAFFELYEDSVNYLQGSVNVYTPKYRIVISFQSNQTKRQFRSFVHHNHKNKLFNLRLIDDSNPENGQFQIYLTPKNGSKTNAVDHIINQICLKLNLNRSDLYVLIAGDSLPDLDMGIKAAKDTIAKFLLVGGSRLSQALTCLKANSLFDEEINPMKKLLHIINIKGYYEHLLYGNRFVIVGDEAFKGKIAAESILSFLNDKPFLAKDFNLLSLPLAK
jgi:hydroxymethylpyrimidine pyrophosphatase-like HAD family hydrolase